MTDEQYEEHTALFTPQQKEVDQEFMVRIANTVREHCQNVAERHGEAAAMMVNAGILLWQHAAEAAMLYGSGDQLSEANALLTGLLNSATSYAADVPTMRRIVQAELDALIKTVNGLQEEYNEAMIAAQGLPN